MKEGTLVRFVLLAVFVHTQHGLYSLPGNFLVIFDTSGALRLRSVHRQKVAPSTDDNG